MSKVIAISNQKGGTGKSTTTVNLSVGLASYGKKVLCCDADAYSGSSGRLFRKYPDIKPEISGHLVE